MAPFRNDADIDVCRKTRVLNSVEEVTHAEEVQRKLHINKIAGNPRPRIYSSHACLPCIFVSEPDYQVFDL